MDLIVTRSEYQRICARLGRKAIHFAAKMSADEKIRNVDVDVDCPKCKRPADAPCAFTIGGQDAPDGFVHNERAVAARDAQREHWIDVFMDEHLPDIDADVLLAVTGNADAWGNANKEIRAIAAFQADVWAAINQAAP